ncbi:hypothetical protein EV182_004611, partial [Spiromyces aspiralis]
SDSNHGDLPRISKDERIVGRVTVEVDSVGAFSDGGLPGCTIGTCVRSEKTEERLTATHLVGVTSSTFPIAMESAIEKQSIAEGLAAGQIGDGGLNTQEVTYAGRRLCSVAEGLAVTPTNIETLSATIRAPDKTRTIAETCLPPSRLLPKGSNESLPCQAVDTDEEKKGATQERYERAIRAEHTRLGLEIGDRTQKRMITITNQEDQEITSQWADPYEIAEAHGNGSGSIADLVRTPSQSPIAGYRLKDFFICASTSPDSSSAREDVVGIGSTVVPQGNRGSAEG